MTNERPGFVTTKWSVVLAASGRDETGRAAIAQLCEAYWFPLYAYARRLGRSEHDAADAVQGFVADLVAREAFEVADPRRGRFREFLRRSLRNWLANDAARARAEKRGGGVRTLSLDAGAAAAGFSLEPATSATPERAFERSFAIALLRHALDDVEDRYAEKNRSILFDSLRPSLTGHRLDYDAIAASLGTTSGALRVAAHRLRDEYRAALRARIADTLDAGQDVDAEIEELFGALSS